MFDLGFEPLTLYPQCFVLRGKSRSVIASLAKIVDDILLARPEEVTNQITTAIDRRFKLGNLVHGPGELGFCGLNVTQADDFSVQVDGDDKLQSIAIYPITR